MKNCVITAAVAAALLLVPMIAHAQYKNTSFELDAAGVFITRPAITDSNGSMLANDNLPLRLAVGERIGGAINFKLHEDHWWFGARVNLGLFQYASWGDSSTTTCSQALGLGTVTTPPELGYDCYASQFIGTVLGLQVILGPRYYFLTDRVRPYLQLAVSYMHLFSFTSESSQTCSGVNGYCDNGGAYSDVFLPHSNIFAVHAQPGIEFILKRDVALSLALDVERYLIINASGNFAFTFAVGVVFYG